uniref:Uncharacterized protein n=1 Tax=Oryza barthii TaxID=65489 RepID=A0A0D3GF22_9ORYZ
MPSENVQKKVHANGLDVAPVYKLMKTSIYRESFIAWKNKSSWTKGPKMYVTLKALQPNDMLHDSF